MIFDGMTTDEENPRFYTRVTHKGRYLLIGMAEQELFRHVLGERGFEDAVHKAYTQDLAGQEAESYMQESLKPKKKWWQL